MCGKHEKSLQHQQEGQHDLRGPAPRDEPKHRSGAPTPRSRDPNHAIATSEARRKAAGRAAHQIPRRVTPS